METIKSRKDWTNVQQVMKDHRCQPSQTESKKKVKIPQDKIRFKEFVATKLALGGILEGTLRSE